MTSPTIGDRGQWGGEVGIFVVDLFNVLLTPALCVLFYLCCLELGYDRRTSLASTLLLGLATGVVFQAQTYFDHNLVGAALLGAFLAHNDRTCTVSLGSLGEPSASVAEWKSLQLPESAHCLAPAGLHVFLAR